MDLVYCHYPIGCACDCNGTILYMAGYDLKKPLQNIPGISSLVGSDDTSKTSSSNNDQRDTELKALKKTIKEQENELEIAQKT